MKRLAVNHDESEIVKEYLDTAMYCGEYFAEHKEDFSKYIDSLKERIEEKYNKICADYKKDSPQYKQLYEEYNGELTDDLKEQFAEESIRNIEGYNDYLYDKLEPVMREFLTDETFEELKKEDSDLVDNILDIMFQKSDDYYEAIDDIKFNIADELIS